jgi:hypothetical protein
MPRPYVVPSHSPRTANWMRHIFRRHNSKSGNDAMKKTSFIPAITLLCSISGAAWAQNSNPGIPKGAQVDCPDAPSESLHGVMPVPLPESSPATIPGGLYRLANGFMSCPDTLYLMSGQPNLRTCTYVKDLH